MTGKYPHEVNVLLYWQHKIFDRILRAGIVLGIIAYIPSMTISVVYKIWPVAVLDTLILTALICLYFIKNIKFSIRVFLFNSILYVLGTGLLIYLGPEGAGWIWLTVFPALCTLLSGFRAFIIAMVTNVCTLFMFGLFLYFNVFDSYLISNYSLESWIINSTNFLCTNLLICYPIGILVKEMKAALDKEKDTQKLLLNEREALAIKNEDLVRTNNDLDNFIYTASHDLKAPISNIEGLINNLNLVLKDKTQEVSFLLDLVFRSSERVNNTIKDLTEISKLHHNTEGTNKDLINISSLIGQIIEDLNAEKISIHQQLDVVEINFSRKNLRSIIYNLISNAIKYASPERKPEISIHTYFVEKFFVLRLSDNGLGMAEGYREKIFKMFKRMHDHVEGSGLGLYILNRIVENNGGKIEVESKVNEGTTFTIFLKT